MTDVDDIRQSALKSIGWITLEKWGVRVIQLGMFAFLGRLLEPSAFGLIALAAVFTAFFNVFVDAGFAQVLVQRQQLEDIEISTAFWTSLGLAMLMYGVLAAIAYPLAVLYHEPQLAPILWVLGLQLPITAAASVPGALLIRRFAFRTEARRQLTGASVGAVAGVACALAGLGVWALVTQLVGGAAVSCVVLWYAGGWRPRLSYSVAALRGMATFGISILGTEMINLLNSQADKLLVGSLLGAKALGYYYVGSRILTLISDSTTAVIARMSLTTFSKLQRQPERLVRAFNAATFTSAAVALPVFGALAVLAPVVVPLLFGSQWSPSVIIMQILVPSTALTSILYFDKSALLARGFSRDAFSLAVLNTVWGLILVAAAAPLGVAWVAASRTLRQFTFWPVRQHFLRTRIGLSSRVYLKQFVAPLVSTLVSSAAMWALLQVMPQWPIAQLLAAVLVGAVVYLVAITYLAGDRLRTLMPEVTGLPKRLLARVAS